MNSHSTNETAAEFPGRWLPGILYSLLVSAGLLAFLVYLLGPSVTGSELADWQLPGVSALVNFVNREAGLMGLPLTSDSPGFWYASRAAGLVGYLLLWAVTAWGLVISSKMNRGLMPASTAVRVHTVLSTATLGMTGLHALVLLGDRYINFSLAGILYPFAAEYRPLWVGLGQMSFYLVALLMISQSLRKALGQKTWRLLHYVSFVVYGLVLVHAVAIGTDASQPLVRLMYLVTGSIIMLLVHYRLLTGWSAGRSRTAAPRPARG